MLACKQYYLILLNIIKIRIINSQFTHILTFCNLKNKLLSDNCIVLNIFNVNTNSYFKQIYNEICSIKYKSKTTNFKLFYECIFIFIDFIRYCSNSNGKMLLIDDYNYHMIKTSENANMFYLNNNIRRFFPPFIIRSLIISSLALIFSINMYDFNTYITSKLLFISTSYTGLKKINKINKSINNVIHNLQKYYAVFKCNCNACTILVKNKQFFLLFNIKSEKLINNSANNKNFSKINNNNYLKYNNLKKTSNFFINDFNKNNNLENLIEDFIESKDNTYKNKLSNKVNKLIIRCKCNDSNNKESECPAINCNNQLKTLLNKKTYSKTIISNNYLYWLRIEEEDINFLYKSNVSKDNISKYISKSKGNINYIVHSIKSSNVLSPSNNNSFNYNIEVSKDSAIYDIESNQIVYKYVVYKCSICDIWMYAEKLIFDKNSSKNNKINTMKSNENINNYKEKNHYFVVLNNLSNHKYEDKLTFLENILANKDLSDVCLKDIKLSS